MLKKRKSRRNLLCAVTLVAAVALIFAAPYLPNSVAASAATRKLPVYCVQRDDKCVSLTFDAAWGDVRVRQ